SPRRPRPRHSRAEVWGSSRLPLLSIAEGAVDGKVTLGVLFRIGVWRTGLGGGFVIGWSGLGSALGNAHHGRPQHAIADHITRLHDLHDRVGRNLWVGNLEHGLVEMRVEPLAFRLELLHAMAL